MANRKRGRPKQPDKPVQLTHKEFISILSLLTNSALAFPGECGVYVFVRHTDEGVCICFSINPAASSEHETLAA